MRIAELKALERERGLRGYSRLRKAELIALLWKQSVRVPEPQPMPPPFPASCTRPPRPRRDPPPPPTSVRFRPDRPRQPELIRQLEERNPQPPKPSPPLAGPIPKLYWLKPKRGKETFMEPPMEQPPSGAKCPTSGDPKKLKRMKKRLDELNRKIRHSRKKHNGLIHKQNFLRKAIEGLKSLGTHSTEHGTKPPPGGASPEPMPEPKWNFKEQDFNGDYRSYRVNGRPKMDVDTFFS